MPETTTEVPKALEAMVDMVLRYKPKPVSAAAKKRKRKQKKACLSGSHTPPIR